MIKINYGISLEDFRNRLKRFWEVSGQKIRSIEKEYDPAQGSPVFTVNGIYTTRGWTEWTQGFQYGSSILNFEVTGEKEFLEIGKVGTVGKMALHVSNLGVHDHGFNNLSTYGNLLRMMNEGRIEEEHWERNFYELALKISGAVQSARWTPLNSGGFIYSFNGPHSLFIDTIRSVRILMVSHRLGHSLLGEGDLKINLLERAINHIRTTAQYSVYYGEERDRYDVPGRTVHECIFNIKNGSYRNSASQQGYSGRTTWMRGLAWAMLGFAEELEILDYLDEMEFAGFDTKDDIKKIMVKALTATCDYYIDHCPVDGIPYWDSGAPDLDKIKNYLEKPADPFNAYEPVDSSAAVIASQGLLRFGNYLKKNDLEKEGNKYFQSGLTIFDRLLSETYFSDDPDHQGLILHSIYHHPGAWDYQPEKNKAPYGESSMWGDYHAREIALYIYKLLSGDTYYSYFNCVK